MISDNPAAYATFESTFLPRLHGINMPLTVRLLTHMQVTKQGGKRTCLLFIGNSPKVKAMQNKFLH
jgi:hypothetical protein